MIFVYKCAGHINFILPHLQRQIDVILFFTYNLQKLNSNDRIMKQGS